MQSSSSTSITMRPPNLSVHMPSGTRISEPVSTGVAASRPNSVAFSPSVFLIGMPITPNIIQTVKHTVNASVLTKSTERACLSRVMAGRQSVVVVVHDSRVYQGPRPSPGGATAAIRKDERRAHRVVLSNHRRARSRAICAGSTQAGFGCDNRGLHARAHPELAQHLLHVVLHRGFGDAEVAADFLVA